MFQAFTRCRHLSCIAPERMPTARHRHPAAVLCFKDERNLCFGVEKLFFRYSTLNPPIEPYFFFYPSARAASRDKNNISVSSRDRMLGDDLSGTNLLRTETLPSLLLQS